MSMYEYVKSIVDIDRLSYEIGESVNIVTELDYITYNSSSTILRIYFIGDLSNDEEVTLNDIVTNHGGQQLPQTPEILATTGIDRSYTLFADGENSAVWLPAKEYIFTFKSGYRGVITDYVKIYRNTIWTSCATFIFKGNLFTPVSTFKICAWVGGSKDLGYVRLYDYYNNKEICEVKVSNEKKYIYTLETLYNIPDNETIFEIHGMVKPSSKLYLSYVTLY